MAVSILVQRFSVAFDGKAQVIPQNPLRLSDDLDDTELPQPDVMLVKNQLYLNHPKPADVLLLVEASDSTLTKDSGCPRISMRSWISSKTPNRTTMRRDEHALHRETLGRDPRALS
jgi:hypothetical protein